MIEHEQFKKMKEYKEIGLSKEKTRQHLKITRYEINKWWNLDEREFLSKQGESRIKMDRYREFIISHLRVCPQMHDTNIRYKLREAFPDFDVPRCTFQYYMKKLREQTGYVRPFSRQTSVRADLPPAYEAHKLAFKYFGGRTQTILYDQDRVFVVSDTLGTIFFVNEFEEFVRKTGFQVVLCRPQDPQSKGKVEEVVKHVKENFLCGRIYSGIDSLNTACLACPNKNGKIYTIAVLIFCLKENDIQNSDKFCIV